MALVPYCLKCFRLGSSSSKSEVEVNRGVSILGGPDIIRDNDIWSEQNSIERRVPDLLVDRSHVVSHTNGFKSDWVVRSHVHGGQLFESELHFAKRQMFLAA